MKSTFNPFDANSRPITDSFSHVARTVPPFPFSPTTNHSSGPRRNRYVPPVIFDRIPHTAGRRQRRHDRSPVQIATLEAPPSDPLSKSPQTPSPVSRIPDPVPHPVLTCSPVVKSQLGVFFFPPEPNFFSTPPQLQCLREFAQHAHPLHHRRINALQPFLDQGQGGPPVPLLSASRRPLQWHEHHHPAFAAELYRASYALCQVQYVVSSLLVLFCHIHQPLWLVCSCDCDLILLGFVLVNVRG